MLEAIHILKVCMSWSSRRCVKHGHPQHQDIRTSEFSHLQIPSISCVTELTFLLEDRTRPRPGKSILRNF